MTNKTPSKSRIIIQKSDRAGVVCFGRLVGPSGMFVDFEFDQDMAETTLGALKYHLEKYKNRN
tara:strand:- start:355 stop:543 length:189 start_codon:yes stop_codon:yes gene_type:complete